MANEYIDRIVGERAKTPPTPEGFKIGLSQLEAKLTPEFIEIAKILAPDGEAQIIHAQSELSQRVRIMGKFINPRTASHNISNLYSSIIVSENWLQRSDIPPEALDLDQLRNLIVHSVDPVRKTMFNNRLILSEGKRLLKQIDRDSPYYYLRKPEISVEMEEI